jgi:hypothetical protein
MAVQSLQEWRSDPSGTHQYRFFVGGRPTTWVSDAGAVSRMLIIPPDSPPPTTFSTATLQQKVPKILTHGPFTALDRLSSEQFPVDP